MSDVTKMTDEQLLEYFEAEGNKPFTSSKSPERAEYETTRAELLRRLSRSQDGPQGCSCEPGNDAQATECHNLRSLGCAPIAQRSVVAAIESLIAQEIEFHREKKHHSPDFKAGFILGLEQVKNHLLPALGDAAVAQDGVDVEGLAQRIESQVIADVIQWRGRSDESKAERILILKAIIHSALSSAAGAPLEAKGTVE